MAEAEPEAGHRVRAADLRAVRLQQQVRQRTLEIAEQKTTIEALLDRKNELFAAISHEFRTPLTLLLGPVQQLRQQTAESAQPQLDLIERSGLRLLNLVEQLLALAKNSLGAEPQRHPQDVSKQLARLVALFEPVAAESNISIQFTPPPTRLLGLVEDDTIELVVGNLLSNAIKYSAASSHVSLTVDTNDNELCIRVADQGPGIPDTGAAQMGTKIAMSNRQLQRKLKAIIDFTPSDYLREYRLKKAAELLATGRQIGLIAEAAGFSSHTQFGRCFKAKFGCSPKQFQRQQGKRT